MVMKLDMKKRLEDIKQSHGAESLVYKKAYKIIKNILQKNK